MHTGMAVRDNEVKQRQNFGEKFFPGVVTCGFHLVGYSGTQYCRYGCSTFH